MSGHNKWSKIKHKKEVGDAKKSNVFSKLSKQIISESKKSGGDINSPGLAAAIDAAKKENMPKDTIERAIKKGTDKNTASLESVVYEAYGPGGVAIIIEGLTDNNNRTAAEIRHILAKRSLEIATKGSASWAFTKNGDVWAPSSFVPLSDADSSKLSDIISELDELEDVQGIYTNAS